MTKKCIGCGLSLQDTKKDELGYTPDLKNNYCMRCFKLTHYNELINKGVNIDNAKLIASINKKKIFVIFLVDFLNIYEEVIDTYKKITCEKILVITKSDLIPNNIKTNTLINNIRDLYDIKEDIVVTSSKEKNNIGVIAKICKSKKNVLIAGFTNAGKSSIINKLMDSNITVSSKLNTTQDFIKISGEDYTIYDAPGFISNTSVEDNIPSKEVSPITYQMNPKYYLHFLDINLYFQSDTNITMYMKKMKIDKLRLKNSVSYDVCIPSNSDLIIKGLGFIKFSKATFVSINIAKDLYEVRPSIVGGKNE